METTCIAAVTTYDHSGPPPLTPEEYGIATSTHTSLEAAQQWCVDYAMQNPDSFQMMVLTDRDEWNGGFTEDGSLLWAKGRPRGQIRM